MFLLEFMRAALRGRVRWKKERSRVRMSRFVGGRNISSVVVVVVAM